MQIRKKNIKDKFEVSSCLIRHEKPNWNFCIHFQELCKILCFMYIIFVAFPLGSGIMWSDKFSLFVCDWQLLDYFWTGLGLRLMRLGLQASIFWLLTFSSPGTRVLFDHCFEHTIKFNCQVWYLTYMIRMATFGNID